MNRRAESSAPGGDTRRILGEIERGPVPRIESLLKCMQWWRWQTPNEQTSSPGPPKTQAATLHIKDAGHSGMGRAYGSQSLCKCDPINAARLGAIRINRNG